MISEKAVEAAAREAVRFTLHKAPDGVRIFKDGERFEGPWGYHEMDASRPGSHDHQHARCSIRSPSASAG